MRPLASPLVSPLAAAVGEAVGGLPAPTHYVSQTATNGYAVGANVGAGTTKAAPWLTLDYAAANAPAGSIIAVNDGTYTAATFLSVDTSLEIRAHNRRLVTLRSAAGQARVVNLTSTLDRTWTLRGLVLDGQNDAQGGVTIGSAAQTSIYTVNVVDCQILNTSQRLILSNSQKRVNLNVRGCEASGTWAGLSLVQVLLHEAGHISIDGLTVNGTMTNTSTKHVVQVKSLTGATTADIFALSGTVAASSASGGMYGVRLLAFDNAAIRGCNLSISAPAGGVGALYWILCDDAARTANNGVIANNRGHNGCGGGYGAIIGQDGTTVGDNKQNNGTISHNTLTANSAAATPIHGLMIGYGTGGAVYGNSITGAGLATIAKQQSGGEFYDNTIAQFTSEAIRAKGATGTTWRDNTVTVSASFAGDCVNINSNDAPVTASTGIVIDGNVFHIDAAPANIVEVTVGSAATFTGNTYNVNTTLGADAWSYQGTTYDTLAEWKAGVEPTALP